LLELALLASDNRAASALARNYPGGIDAFNAAVARKIHALGLESTLIEEPTGLSPNNLSSAEDMVKLLRAAAAYPEIAQVTSRRDHAVLINGHRRTVRNTNRLVGSPGWHILLSKTGYTNEAGRCLSMRVQAAGRTVIVVLMGAVRPSHRAVDATNILRWLSRDAPVTTMVAHKAQRRLASHGRSDGALEPRPTLASASTHERAGPPQGRIPERAARRYSNERLLSPIEASAVKPVPDAADSADAPAKPREGPAPPAPTMAGE
jgi:D-alanyl-D-alanine endopeptidase (penicillin-binding protein 7)